jgi:flagellar biogenesis protein FliO
MTNVLVWILNGFLVVIYFLADHIFAIALLALLVPFVLSVPDFLKPRSFIVAGLALTACLLAPMPVPFFLTLMTGAAWIVRKMEKFNRLDARWLPIQNIGIYSVMGLAFWGFRNFGVGLAPAANDPLLAQGWTYLNYLVGIIVYIAPLGFLAWALKDLFAHPNIPGGTPENLMGTIRTGGQRR